MFEARYSVAKALIFDASERVLIVRRSQTHPTLAFQADLPGGMVELDELPLVAVVREVLEEAGLVIEAKQVKLVHEVKNPRTGWHYLIYESRLTANTPAVTLSWEHDQFEWLTVAELLKRARPLGTDPYMLAVYDYLDSGRASQVR